MGSICLTKHKNDDWFRSRRQIRGGFLIRYHKEKEEEFVTVVEDVVEVEVEVEVDQSFDNDLETLFILRNYDL